jgi:putative toxin-antitoxin system antitoxin component (TIGR02293 family)
MENTIVKSKHDSEKELSKILFQLLLKYSDNPSAQKRSIDRDSFIDNFQDTYVLHQMSSIRYPAKFYRGLKDCLFITGDEYRNIMGHTWRTVLKKKSNELLDADYSEKLVAASKVLAQGVGLFGSFEKLSHWLRKFNPFLDARPIDLLTTIPGSEIVSDELERLYEGSLA